MAETGFEGDVALVTGAASGIGRATAMALGAAGAKVIATDVLDPGQVVAEIREQGGTAKGLTCDLSGHDGWKTLLAEARSAFGPITVFVHSAAPRRIESQTVLKVTEHEWDAMVDTNLRSGFFLAQGIAQDMIETGIPGRILFMASLHAHTPRNLPHYAAAKAGQVMVVKEMARALGQHGIRVNAIAPGAIPGGGFAGDFTALSRKIPMGRPGTPDEVAAGAMALLSPASGAYITGAVLAVDGGLDSYNWIDAPEDP